MEVLYSEIKYMKRSRYRVQKTIKYISKVLHETPLHDFSLIIYILLLRKTINEENLQQVELHSPFFSLIIFI